MGDFKFKLWALKFGKGLTVTLASTGLVYTATYLETTDFPPEYAFWGGLIAVCCLQIGNWVKHTFIVE